MLKIACSHTVLKYVQLSGIVAKALTLSEQMCTSLHGSPVNLIRAVNLISFMLIIALGEFIPIFTKRGIYF